VAHKNLLIPTTKTPPQPGHRCGWGRLVGASAALAAAEFASQIDALLLVLADDPRQADRLESEIRFFGDGDTDVRHFVEWETLPWDSFSPHQDIVSERLSVLAALKRMRRGIVVASAPALLQRLPPVNYVAARSLSLRTGQSLPRAAFIDSLSAAGYLRVPQVSEHGEFAVRGSLIDIFPMGSNRPVRIDFFDDDVESLRYFAPESQLSGDVVNSVDVLPAREIPLDADSIKAFRERYRERFEGQPSRSRVYRDISDGIAHGGIEYYLPLFFDSTASLVDYLPTDCIVLAPQGLESVLERSWAEIEERYELSRLDPERPILSAQETFVTPATTLEHLYPAGSQDRGTLRRRRRCTHAVSRQLRRSGAVHERFGGQA
jgi:transcription-repair coupling factor (superfamily II helicase)